MILSLLQLHQTRSHFPTGFGDLIFISSYLSRRGCLCKRQPLCPGAQEHTGDSCHIQNTTSTCQNFLELPRPVPDNFSSVLGGHSVLVNIAVVPYAIHFLTVFTVFCWLSNTGSALYPFSSLISGNNDILVGLWESQMLLSDGTQSVGQKSSWDSWNWFQVDQSTLIDGRCVPGGKKVLV